MLGVSLMALVGCAHRQTQPTLSSIQIYDKNGMNEAISIPSRLKSYENKNFLEPQPYQKVVRVYRIKGEETPKAKITSYHPNGHICEYLETRNGRAYGTYKRYFDNGLLNMQATVMEGLGDLSEEAKITWLFDEMAFVYDELGNKVAEIPYSKGKLQGIAKYYYPTGKIKKTILYKDDQKHGISQEFDEQDKLVGESSFYEDKKNGRSYFNHKEYKIEEFYKDDLLINAQYLDQKGNVISSIEGGFGQKTHFEDGVIKKLESFENGKPKGLVTLYYSNGNRKNTYYIKNGQKNGKETIYYPQLFSSNDEKVKLCIDWVSDEIQGRVITWYDNERKESEREYAHNSKHGMSFAWYKDGNVMLVEEYENDKLIKGKYFKRGETAPVSQVIKGAGLATIFDEDGHFVKKVKYKDGIVLEE